MYPLLNTPMGNILSQFDSRSSASGMMASWELCIVRGTGKRLYYEASLDAGHSIRPVKFQGNSEVCESVVGYHRILPWMRKGLLFGSWLLASSAAAGAVARFYE